MKWSLTCCSWGWCPSPGPYPYTSLHAHTATHTCPGTVYPKHGAPRHSVRSVSSCLTGRRCSGWPGYRTSRPTPLGPPLCPSANVCNLETRADVTARTRIQQQEKHYLLLWCSMCHQGCNHTANSTEQKGQWPANPTGGNHPMTTELVVSTTRTLIAADRQTDRQVDWQVGR